MNEFSHTMGLVNVWEATARVLSVFKYVGVDLIDAIEMQFRVP